MNGCINGIMIKQCPKNGFLGGPLSLKFSCDYNENTFHITIDQHVIRQTKIVSEQNIDVNRYFELFNVLDMLLMIGDGQFIPIKQAKIIQGKELLESSQLRNALTSRLNQYNSYKLLQSDVSLLNFEQYINTKTFSKWCSLLVELDITHSAVLNALSDIEMLVDIRCAFMIESFKAIKELIETNNPNFKIESDSKKNRIPLKNILASVINEYGKQIFNEEIHLNEEEFCHVLANSRNRIAHIKSRNKEMYLTNEECALYIVKLSFLYRVILLSLLGIDNNLYQDKLSASIKRWDNWNDILLHLKSKLQHKSSPAINSK